MRNASMRVIARRSSGLGKSSAKARNSLEREANALKRRFFQLSRTGSTTEYRSWRRQRLNGVSLLAVSVSPWSSHFWPPY